MLDTNRQCADNDGLGVLFAQKMTTFFAYNGVTVLSFGYYSHHATIFISGLNNKKPLRLQDC